MLTGTVLINELVDELNTVSGKGQHDIKESLNSGTSEGLT